MKAISYSIFGYNKSYPNSFDFNTYLRGLAINARFNRLLYADEWKMVINTDRETYEAWGWYFDQLGHVLVHDETALCRAMLWRLHPIYSFDYTHTICRDLDSVPTLRERKCVEEWLNSGKIVHAMTDSISHTIPMMGGMVGFWNGYFKEITGWQDWEQMMNGVGIDFSAKGSDQAFMNQYIYPKFAAPGSDSIMQHYMLGMANTFLDGFRNRVPDMDMLEEYAESNDCAGHIGAAGFYPPPTFKFLRKWQDKFEDIKKAEGSNPIFFWNHDGTFE